MTRKWVSLSVLFAAACVAWSAQVAAQTAGVGGSNTTTAGSAPTSTGSSSTATGGNVNVLLVKAGDKDYVDRSLQTPINKKACEQGTITVTLAGLPNASQYPFLQVWLQRSPTVDCNTADRSTTIEPNSQCTRLPLSGTDAQLKNITNYTIPVPLGPVCESSGDKTIYFLAMTAENNNDAAQYYAKMTIKVDLEPPSAPTNVTGGTGETQIEVKWTVPALTVYVWTLVDTNAVEGDVDGGTAGCYSNILRPGQQFDLDAPTPPGIIRSRKDTLRTSDTFNGEDWGTNIAAAVVIAGDKAGNPSVLSELACLHVVKTSGFWDRYQENGGKGQTGWGCSVSGPGSRRATETVVTAVFMLGVWAARRRLRRRG